MSDNDNGYVEHDENQDEDVDSYFIVEKSATSAVDGTRSTSDVCEFINRDSSDNTFHST